MNDTTPKPMPGSILEMFPGLTPLSRREKVVTSVQVISVLALILSTGAAGYFGINEMISGLVAIGVVDVLVGIALLSATLPADDDSESETFRHLGVTALALGIALLVGGITHGAAA